ncbi:MAG TPA: hypothetical protein DEP03_10370 [Massilia sp.]|nr:hypothetical protein [Massilia sp.]
MLFSLLNHVLVDCFNEILKSNSFVAIIYELNSFDIALNPIEGLRSRANHEFWKRAFQVSFTCVRNNSIAIFYYLVMTSAHMCRNHAFL